MILFSKNAKIQKLAFRVEADYCEGESQIADICLRQYDALGFALVPSSSIERAKKILDTLGINDEGCHLLFQGLDFVIADQVQRRESDLGLKDNIPGLSLFMSVLVFLSSLLPDSQLSIACLLALFLGLLILTYFVYRNRRKSWDEAFGEGNVFKLKVIRDDLLIYLMTKTSRGDVAE